MVESGEMRMVSLGEVVGEVVRVNPVKLSANSFTYIDLGSIDQRLKVIGAAKTVPTSDAPSRARQVLKPHDVIVSTVRPNLNGVALVPASLEGSIASTGFCVLRPLEGRLNPNYLFHWVQSPLFVADMVRKASGASYPAVSEKIILQSHIPLPPLKEQRRIAAILDKGDELRTKRREALALLSSLSQSIFAETIATADQLSSVSLDAAYWFQEGPGIRKWQFTTSGTKVLNVGNIETTGSIRLDKTDRFISDEEAFGKYSHFLVDHGDLVMPSSGISLDADGLLRTRSAFVEKSHLPLCMNTSTIRFKPRDGVATLTFLQEWLQSPEFRTQITRLVTGSAQLNFGPTHLRQLHISLPTLAVQHKLAGRMAAIENLKNVHRLQLAELEALFAALQHRAFSGQL